MFYGNDRECHDEKMKSKHCETVSLEALKGHKINQSFYNNKKVLIFYTTNK